ncbi:MAG: DUF5131 family protein [Chloroflexota bacterium]
MDRCDLGTGNGLHEGHPGCNFGYPERLSHRLKAMGNRKYANAFELTLHEDALELPIHWKQPKHVFVNSMYLPNNSWCQAAAESIRERDSAAHWAMRSAKAGRWWAPERRSRR